MATGIRATLGALILASFPAAFGCGGSGAAGNPSNTSGGQLPVTPSAGNAGTNEPASGAGTASQAGTAGATASFGGAGAGSQTGGASSAGTPGGGNVGTAGSGSSAGGSTSSSGCGKVTTLMDGRTSMDVAGTMREYILALPKNYDQNKPYKLIFGWHPLGGNAQQVASGGYYGLLSQAKDQAIFVAAEGLVFQGSNLGWGNKNGEDIAFLEAMLERFRSELCVDEDRIFSTGFSFGGMMSFAAGCASKGMMRAIAPMAGNIQVSGCENGTRPVAVMGFHGTHDSVVDISGGRAGRDKFVQRNGCTMETMPADPAWCNGIDQKYLPCSCVAYQGCSPGYPVTWCEYNADHMAAPTSGATLWSFFSQF